MNLAKLKTQPPDRWIVTAAVAVGAIVRFTNISRASIWHDEGYTMMLSPMSPSQIVVRTARDVHPPLYYLLLHYWIKLFGSSEIGARSLSAVATLLVVIVGYLLARRLFGRATALVGAWFLALGPFLVRYGQEARMYGLAALWAVLATYLLVRALKDHRSWQWIAYSLVIAAALYTHYYAVFIIVLHWLYVLLVRRPNWAIKRPQWWLANLTSAILFAPWLPSAYHQFTRVQAGFWIPPASLLTLPSTLAQFLTFTDLGALTKLLRLGAFGAFVVLSLWFGWRKKFYPDGWLIVGLTFLGPLLVLILSLKRPIYVDRYFVFAAVGFYLLLAALIMTTGRSRLIWLRGTLIAVLLLTFGVGIRDVYAQASHRMRLVGDYVNHHYQPGDTIISGELYTYFDFSYYNHTGQTAQLLAPSGMSGYGETSLLYDRQTTIAVNSYLQVSSASGHVWVIGKPGQNDDFKVPPSWRLLDQFQAADSEVRHYQIP